MNHVTLATDAGLVDGIARGVGLIWAGYIEIVIGPFDEAFISVAFHAKVFSWSCWDPQETVLSISFHIRESAFQISRVTGIPLVRIMTSATADTSLTITQLAASAEQGEIGLWVIDKAPNVDAHWMKVFSSELVFGDSTFLVAVPAHLFNGVVARPEFPCPKVRAGSFMGLMAIATQSAPAGLARMLWRRDAQIMLGIGYHGFVYMTVCAQSGLPVERNTQETAFPIPFCQRIGALSRWQRGPVVGIMAGGANYLSPLGYPVSISVIEGKGDQRIF